MQTHFGNRFLHGSRMNTILHQLPWVARLSRDLVKKVGDHVSVDWLGRMTWPPTDHDRLHVVLIQDVPDSFGSSGQTGHWLDFELVWRRLSKAVDSVFVRSLSGRNRGPQHW